MYKVGLFTETRHIRLRLTGRGKQKEEVRMLMDMEAGKLEELLGDDIFDEDDTPLESL